MGDISRRDFGRTLAGAIGAASVVGAPSLTAGRSGSSRTNIVFVCSDIHSARYSGYAGHPLVQTPNLDRIAARGVVFSNNYCTQPVCAASRTGMLTGMFPSDSDSFCNSTLWNGKYPTWGTRLRDVGYNCRAVGKMDIDPSFDTGFQEIDTDHYHATNPDITTLFRRPAGYRVNERPGVEGRFRTEPHHDAVVTDNALDFLKNDVPGLNNPWAIWIGLLQPLSGFNALKKYYDMYDALEIDVPELPPGHIEDLHLVYQELRHFKRISVPLPREPQRRARVAYYGEISELDHNVGRIWSELERSGQLDNTLFIYTSDHGGALGEHGLWYHNHLYDEAIHVPLIMAGAGLPQGVTINTTVGHMDLVHTLLEFAGIDPPTGLRGHSLMPLIEGKSDAHPGYAYAEHHGSGNCTGSFALRKGDWKLISFTWYDDLLFNLAEDPGEFHNRINDPAAAGPKAELTALLNSLVDPEEVTVRAFRTQQNFLERMVERQTEDQLYETFLSRLGNGQARALAAKCKGR
ncbi:sulfatase-like hydrolase/transferase [candidate division KSB1 bacterium]